MINKRIVADVEITDRTPELSQGKAACLGLFVALFMRLRHDIVDRALKTVIVDGYNAYCKATKNPLDLNTWIFQRTTDLQHLAETAKAIERGFNFSHAEMERFFGQTGMSIGVSRLAGCLWDEPIKMGKGFAAFDTYVKTHLANRSDKDIARHLATFSETTVSQDAELVSV
jgi:hypothetical protein